MHETPESPAPDPAAEAEAKAAKLERAKQQLLQAIADSVTGDVRTQVGFILNHFPEARDSDVVLARLLGETFYPQFIVHGAVPLEHLGQVPTQTYITRTRQTIQNTYDLFQASSAVSRFRRGRREDTTQAMGADRPAPGLPILGVHADESGKTQTTWWWAACG